MLQVKRTLACPSTENFIVKVILNAKENFIDKGKLIDKEKALHSLS